MKAEERPLSQKPLIERITPGPWRSDENIYTRVHTLPVIEIGNGEEWLAYVRGRDEKESAANAEAISRVPELLRAEQENANLKAMLLISDGEESISLHRRLNIAMGKIQELEETISALELSNAVMLATVQEGNKIYAKQAAKLEAILKGLEEVRVKTSNLEMYELCKSLLAEHGK